jgi:hypothetical protein
VTLDVKSKRQYFIAVLDIAGFEIFEVSLFLLKIGQSTDKSSRSSMDSNNCVLIIQMNVFNNSSIITCSCWNKKNTRRKASTGSLLISVWIYKLALISLKR